MRLIVLSLMLAFSNVASAFQQSCNTWLSSDQIFTINRAYQLGVQHDLGYTLAAIAFLESSAGVQLRNDRTQDYGVFGINIRTVSNRLNQLTGVTLNHEQRDQLKNHLIVDMNANAMYAVMELQFWQRVHGQNNWRKVWASYNAGHSYHRQVGIDYANKIAETIKRIKRLNCLYV